MEEDFALEQHWHEYVEGVTEWGGLQPSYCLSYTSNKGLGKADRWKESAETGLTALAPCNALHSADNVGVEFPCSSSIPVITCPHPNGVF